MIDNIETDARCGLEVKRYHTWRTIQRQSTGEHSAQVMRILLAIWPTAPRHMLVHCLMHDMGEMAGDIPFPGKSENPVLRQHMQALEDNYYSSMVERWRAPTLENSLLEDERRIFKLAESLEMWEFALTEVNMGNRYAEVVARRMYMAARNYMVELAKHVEIVQRTQDYISRRILQEEK